MMSQKCFSVKGRDSSRQVTILRTTTTVLILKNIHDFHNGGLLGRNGNYWHQSEASRATMAIVW